MEVKNARWQISSRDIWHGLNCLAHCLPLSMALAVENEAAEERTRGRKVDLEEAIFVEQGNIYERGLLAQLKQNLGDNFFQLPPSSTAKNTLDYTARGLLAIAQAKVELTFDDAPIDFVGTVDLLVRGDHMPAYLNDGTLSVIPNGDFASSSTYSAWEIKHSSRLTKDGKEDSDKKKSVANYTNQLAAYVEALDVMGIAASNQTGVIYKQGDIMVLSPGEIVKTYRQTRQGMFRLLSEKNPRIKSAITVERWSCLKPSVCEAAHCEYPSICVEDRAERDDLSQLSGLNYIQRDKLEAAGIDTIAKFEATDISGFISNEVTREFHVQTAKAIIECKQLGGAAVVKPIKSVFAEPNSLPTACENDLFIDFEWFTFVNEREYFYYLLGAVDRNDKPFQFVSDSPTDEASKFNEFLEFVERHLADSAAHCYVISHPEGTGLKTMGLRHGVDQARIESLLSRLVDLQKCAKSSFALSNADFGLKSLEKLFDARRATETRDGADSGWQYHLHLLAKEDGNTAEAKRILDDILQYNLDDLVSTRKLYDWLATLG
jgi:predicted RecB family nuclease